MMASMLPLPEEPRALKTMARTVLDQAPETGLPLVVAGAWIADPLWDHWGAALAERGLDRDQFGRIVAGYGNELRLWVAGERPWEQYISGLAGRVGRRSAPAAAEGTDTRPRPPWRDALGRVGVAADDEMTTLISRIGELHLLYDIAAPDGPAGRTRTPTAIVWAGGRPRDPEVPFGESQSGASSAAALAEALGRFLLKDPAYPPGWVSGRG